MTNKILQVLKDASSICIFTHVNEDGDCVGSALAFKECMRILGKKADVYVDEPIEDRLSFLGSDYIVYYQPTTVPYDVAVSLDSASIDRLGGRRTMFDAAGTTICIDHHGTNVGFADYNLIEPDAIATGEILYYLFKKWDIDFTTRLARCLYTAIASDSGSFKYKNVTSNTFMAAAGLLQYNIDHDEISRNLFDSDKLNIMKLKGYLMSNIESYANGKISLVWSDAQTLAKFGVDESDASNLVDIPRAVKGTIIAIEIKQRSGKIRFSLRANSNDIDVSTISIKHNGGGHKAAAGGTLEGVSTIEKAKEIILNDAIDLLQYLY